MKDEMQETAGEQGMKINVQKTKAMKISKRPGEEVRRSSLINWFSQEPHFNYLGSLITQDGCCEKDRE